MTQSTQEHRNTHQNCCTYFHFYKMRNTLCDDEGEVNGTHDQLQFEQLDLLLCTTQMSRRRLKCDLITFLCTSRYVQHTRNSLYSLLHWSLIVRDKVITHLHMPAHAHTCMFHFMDQLLHVCMFGLCAHLCTGSGTQTPVHLMVSYIELHRHLVLEMILTD